MGNIDITILDAGTIIVILVVAIAAITIGLIEDMILIAPSSTSAAAASWSALAECARSAASNVGPCPSTVVASS